jgi:hypothetical protein
MADNEHPGGPVAKYTVTNPTRGARFVNTPDGQQVAIPPNGGQRTLDLTKAEARSAASRGDLQVSKTGKATPATDPAAGGGGEGGGAGDGGEGGGDDNDKAVAYVAHEKFGDYFGYTSEGVKVEGAGPWKKDAAQTWATENKVEFKGSGS